MEDYNKGYDAYWNGNCLTSGATDEFAYGWQKAQSEDYGFKQGNPKTIHTATPGTPMTVAS